MAPETIFDQAVNAVADGEPVDWSLLESQASDDDERDQLKWLRLLGDVAELHRSAGQGVELSPGKRTTREDDTAAPEVAALQRWGRFHLLEQVGEGSFGRVYRAWDPQLEREVAIKILHAQFSSDRLTERLLHEGRALAKIRHANVVSVYAVESHEGRVGLCMEFVRGQTLDDVLRTDGTFSPRATALAGQDVCRALAAVHRAGFVHRDVKARNVMREEGGRIVLMDFGTGQDVRAPGAVRTQERAGTPLYMAPEVLAGGADTPCSDVYSLGVLMFHLLTNAYPVQATTMEELHDAHRAGRRQALRGGRVRVPATLARIVERASAPAPDGRYPHTGPLLQALEHAYPTDARVLEFRRRAGAALAGGAVLLCVLLALGWLTSIAFNNTLERSDFTDETYRDWLVWGLRASVGPAVLSLLAWVLCACAISIASLLRRSSDNAGAIEASVRRVAGRLIPRGVLNDVTVLASWTLLACSAALIALWWHFSPLIDAFSTGVSFGKPEVLALLSPALIEYHDSYRQAFSALVFASVTAWLAVRRRAAIQGRLLPTGITAGAVFMIGLTLASLDLPYRLLLHNKFDAVSWKGETCYLLGQRTDDVLLFCPRLPTPRNRVVPKAEAQLTPLRHRENVYTAFATP
jgi:serine/threonine-protein kinase